MCLKVFKGSGYLICDRFTDRKECDFWLGQLINGRILVKIYGLKISDSAYLRNVWNRIDAFCFSLAGRLEDGCNFEATNIYLNWSMSSFAEGDSFEGYVLYPGYVEFTHPNYTEGGFHPTVVHEVTNLSLSNQPGSLEASFEHIKMKIYRRSEHNKFLKYANELKTAKVLCLISFDILKQQSEKELDDLIHTLCTLLSLAQRSSVHPVASHWKDVNGTTKKRRYQEPVFHYPPFARPLIPVKSLANFIEIGLKNYEVKWANWKLPWVIDYYVQSMSLREYLAQSIGFFTALETLRNAFDKQFGKRKAYHVSSKDFKDADITDRILNLLANKFPAYTSLPDFERESLKKRIDRLNECAYSGYESDLIEMFKGLKISYEKDEIKKLVELRNQIIHGSVSPKPFEDVAMVAGVLERTILRILDYSEGFEQYNEACSYS